ncbi:ATP-dependent DNA helicase RecG [Promicromonospora umidemergens]|uniref:Probable DNA 3'-5' helicase RecG n=1 Tax=Promicromonospora umidemergens TaxID=629679 RepID=A0ABP8X7T9_9MICO|nr:ATP-dependent DNA helicase RecG [Promicromonospora umidemergens]MCP2281161.1 ATP-dependent DNA helicase RecG [Promicromonospora umidemergens]
MTERVDERLERAFDKRTATALGKLGLRTVGDLLGHYPRRYADPGALSDIAALEVGEHVTILARVEQATVRPMRNRKGALMEVVVTDGNSRLSLTFFGKHRGSLFNHEKRLVPGATGLFTGTVGLYRGARQLTHPDFTLMGEESDLDSDEALLEHATKPIPIYPAAAGIPSWKIQGALRVVLDTLTDDDVPDPVPDEVRERQGMPGRAAALRSLHRPATVKEAYRAQHRMRFEEAFVLQAALAQRRARTAAEDATARPPLAKGKPSLLADFDASLPFVLTDGQRAVGDEIATELADPRPMHRLLQGEVGSGKTVVALRAMLQVVDAGGQAALLAPTEVLAAQHARTLRALLGPLAEGGTLFGAEHAGASTRIALLTGSLGAKARKAALLQAASGEAGIVVGTHALLSEQVQFADLGLVVVDEQHRFGVEQRDALRAKGRVSPHLLVMTATPIPRTVAMTVFGDLETSSLTEVPAGRAGITTVAVPARNTRWTDRTWARVREEVDAGRRAYVVCARIHPDEETRTAAKDFDEVPEFLDPSGPAAEGAADRPPLRAVLEVVEELRSRPELAGIDIGMLHGQLPADQKEEAMARFASGEVPVLVATTVIEVGVDVPEATAMVIFDADRFGISQLHQLRGRVGRGTDPGLCLLVSDAEPGTPAYARLEAMTQTTDGFKLANLDLELRSEGDVLGAAQSGRTSSLRLLRVVKDAGLIEEARTAAVDVVRASPDLTEFPELAKAIRAQLDEDQEEFLERA